MQFTETELKGVWLIEPTPVIDDRGSFTRLFCEKEMADCGLATRFVQHSRAHSVKKGTLRGLHYQEDPYTEVKLVSCVRGAIFDELRRLDWIPRSVHEKARKVQGAYEFLEQKFGRLPKEDEVAKHLELSPAEFEELQAEIRPATFVCLDSLVGSDHDNETTNHEWVADRGHEGPDETIAQKELTGVIAQRLEQLPEMQRKVLALYYFEDMRLREIAETFGVTESRICQIHSQAILAIKSLLRKKDPEVFNASTSNA